MSLLDVMYARCLLPNVLVEMESTPFQLDPQRVREIYQATIQKREEIARKLYTITGGVNLNSGPQLAEYLYNTLGFAVEKRTAKGAPATDQDTIKALVATTDEQKQFIEMYFEHNSLTNMLSKSLELFHGLCDENDGKLYIETRQCTTATHRFSSTGIPFKHSSWKKARRQQGQNIQREMKKLFRSAEEGFLVAECDGSQLEFRVAVGASQDPVGMQEIESGVDVHALTAEVYKCSRQDAKPRTFKPLYGGTSGSDLDKKYAKAFVKKYKVINQMQEKWVQQVLLSPTNTLKLPWGMQYQFPGTSVNRNGYVNTRRDIFNYPLQGLATGEIIPLAMYLMYINLPKDGSIRMVGQIHDSIKCLVRADMVDYWRELALWSMTKGVRELLKMLYNYDLKVQLGIGAKVSTHWADTKDERALEYTLDGRWVEVVKVDGVKQFIPYTFKNPEILNGVLTNHLGTS